MTIHLLVLFEALGLFLAATLAIVVTLSALLVGLRRLEAATVPVRQRNSLR